MTQDLQKEIERLRGALENVRMVIKHYTKHAPNRDLRDLFKYNLTWINDVLDPPTPAKESEGWLATGAPAPCSCSFNSGLCPTHSPKTPYETLIDEYDKPNPPRTGFNE